MEVYIVLYIFTVFFCFLETNIKVVHVNNMRLKTEDISFWVLSIYILVLGVIRDGIQFTDGISYMANYWKPYRKADFMDIFQGHDFGYLLVNWIIGKFTSEFWVFEAILFIITFIPMAVWIRKYSKNVSLAFFVYISLVFLPFEFTLLRNALAVSVFVWSYDFLVKRKPFKFFLTVLLAATFHQTALFMLIEYPLLMFKDKKNRRLVRYIYMAGSIFMSLTVGIWVSFIYKKDDYSSTLGEGGWNLLLYYIVLFALLYILIKKFKCDKTVETNYQLAVSTLYFQIISTAVSIGTRMLKYSTTYLFILIPGIMDGRNRKTRNVILLAIVCFLSILFFREIGSTFYVSRF